MSSSTALLPKDRKKDDHPIFLRVCHSPWISIGQKALVGLRSLIAAYLFLSFLMIIDYEIRVNKSEWLTAFKFSNVSYLLQLLYQSIACIWTLMHLYYPHHGSQSRSAKTRIQRFFSPPRQHSETRNRAWFSIFYTTANTFPYVAGLVHWAIMVPEGKALIPGDHTFGHGWATTFFVVNKYLVSAGIAFIEVFFLSSIKRQEPLYAHIPSLAFLAWVYIGWAYIGYIVTDKYVYWFLDHNAVGWEYTIGSWVGAAVLTNLVFGFVYLVTGAREVISKKCQHKSSGYSQLPQ